MRRGRPVIRIVLSPGERDTPARASSSLTQRDASRIVSAVPLTSRQLRRCVAWLLLVHLVVMWCVVLAHNHADSKFHDNCPACHQEKVVGTQPAALHTAALKLIPVFQWLMPAPPPPSLVLDPVLASRSPRGPPLPL
jgi:hypothetical protein